MLLNPRMLNRASILLSLMLTLTILSTRPRADSGMCGGQMITLPFTDVAGSPFFCQIASAFFTGLTNGTTATTYSPADVVNREQMAAFITRTLDQSLKRGSRRAALDQWWTPKNATALGLTAVGDAPRHLKSDGADLWVPNTLDGTVSRVRASDGKLLETWTGAESASAVLIAAGRVFIIGGGSRLYSIDPSQPPGAVTLVSDSLGLNPRAIAYDGMSIWTANAGAVSQGSVSKYDLSTGMVTTHTDGFGSPEGMLYDGANIWVTEQEGTVKKVNPDGSVALTVSLPDNPGVLQHPTFDGTNIWVPSLNAKVYVVRAGGALAGTVLAVLTGNGLNTANSAAFDGERVLVTNFSLDTLSLWKASDFTPLGSVSTGLLSTPIGVCSDGINFWVSLGRSDSIARF